MSVFEYLESMPGTTFRRLYQHPSTALAIFRRMLPHLGILFSCTLNFPSLTLYSQNLCDEHALHPETAFCGRVGSLDKAWKHKVGIIIMTTSLQHMTNLSIEKKKKHSVYCRAFTWSLQ